MPSGISCMDNLGVIVSNCSADALQKTISEKQRQGCSQTQPPLCYALSLTASPAFLLRAKGNHLHLTGLRGPGLLASRWQS